MKTLKRDYAKLANRPDSKKVMAQLNPVQKSRITWAPMTYQTLAQVCLKLCSKVARLKPILRCNMWYLFAQKLIHTREA